MNDNIMHKAFPGVLAAVITFTLYLPALRNDFVNWDDYSYISENLNIRSMDITFLKWGFTDTKTGHWIPLTWLSFASDYAVWGLNPSSYHLTNIILHSLNTFMVFIFAVNTVKLNNHHKDKLVVTAGFITSLLFGVHPLHVESVAWATERKDVLSTFFFLLSLLSYIQYSYAAGLKRHTNYCSCLLFFNISLMAKPMAISLPVILLILDFFPLKRLTGFRQLQHLFVEKLPFFASSILSASLAMWAAQSVSTIETLDAFEAAPLMHRGLVVIWAYIFYLHKMLMPFNLAPLYPYPQKATLLSFKYMGSIILFLLTTYYCFRFYDKKRGLLAAWLCYIVALMPVIGIIKVGPQAAADRYTYLTSLAPFLLAGVVMAMLFESSAKNIYPRLFTVILVLLLCIQTVKQTAAWHDSTTLWSRVIKLFPDTAFIAYNNRGLAYQGTGNYEMAINDYRTALKINPGNMDTHNNLGLVYLSNGELDEARKEFMAAIKIKPDFGNPHNNLGLLYAKQGKKDEALREYKAALRLKPALSAGIHINIGNIYYEQGRLEDAINEFNASSEIDPAYPLAHINLAKAYEKKGMFNDAAREYAILFKLNPIGLKPVYPEAHNDLGIIFAGQRQIDKAITEFKTAVEQKPDFADAYYNLGNAYLGKGMFDDAVIEYKNSIRLKPTCMEAYFNMGNAYMAEGLRDEALKAYNSALKLDPANPLILKTIESFKKTLLRDN